jgi:hypothetical protein
MDSTFEALNRTNDAFLPILKGLTTIECKKWILDVKSFYML